MAAKTAGGENGAIASEMAFGISSIDAVAIYRRMHHRSNNLKCSK
jgi:hypothetical protein